MENNQNAKHNTCSILGFIFSFLFALVGLILSIIGLNKAKKEGNKTGLATAGIIISVINMILGAILGATAASSVLNVMDTAKQKTYDNYIYIIENYAQLKYNNCKSQFVAYNSNIFDSNTCELTSNYSYAAITEAGIDINDIAYVTINIIDDEVEIVDAADGTGSLEGTKFHK